MGAALNDLRCHITSGAPEEPWLLRAMRQAKVDENDLALRGHDGILRLDVAVKNRLTLGVRTRVHVG